MELKAGIKIINTVIHECLKTKKDAIVAVVDQNGELVTFARTDGAPLSSLQLAINMAYTATRLQQETQTFSIQLAQKNPEDLRFYNDPKIVTWPGGIPVYDPAGKLIGGIGISGMSDEENISLAHQAREAIKPTPPKPDNSLKLYS
ncbi:GlcG/HbpS family heme-binding protein [Reichenbachiella agariperforans]|uniref:GlcG/HbpS family heme-binding protein n=1 Tax=Reichenbachiella agariperforans TaxID=156994 RepID=UPI001C094C3B|nr:heme-binding protein [Reichenbachiella agariperforans]MBU2916257.1 heme-binding protein [Reichenbachiella agariperforans]